VKGTADKPVAIVALLQTPSTPPNKQYATLTPAYIDSLRRNTAMYLREGLPLDADIPVSDYFGNDQDAEHILMHGVRCSLADGWGGSMMSTDISDILFGTPGPVASKSNFGILKEDEVNVVVHGHEPTLSEMIVVAAQDPEIIKYAKSKGAKGVMQLMPFTSKRMRVVDPFDPIENIELKCPVIVEERTLRPIKS
jgi:hypothetical protein